MEYQGPAFETMSTVMVVGHVSMWFSYFSPLCFSRLCSY